MLLLAQVQTTAKIGKYFLFVKFLRYNSFLSPLFLFMERSFSEKQRSNFTKFSFIEYTRYTTFCLGARHSYLQCIFRPVFLPLEAYGLGFLNELTINVFRLHWPDA